MREEEEIKAVASADPCDWDRLLDLYKDHYPAWTLTREDYDGNSEMTLDQSAAHMASLGKTDEALGIYQTILDIKERTEGEKGRGVLYARQQMGSVLMLQHKYEEALALLEEVLKDQLDLLGDNEDPAVPDPDETRQLIGTVLEGQGKLEEALPIQERVARVYAKHYGETDLGQHVGFTLTSLKLKMAAAERGDIDLPSILEIIDYGPTVFSLFTYGEDNESFDTVLHRAVKTNNVQILGPVLEAILAEEEEEKVVKYLNFENSEIQTPLTLAVKHDCADAVRYLLEKGIPKGLDVNKVTAFNETALSTANWGTNTEIKELMAEYNAALPPEAAPV
jgi:tetratricopeptide (TPR) repeat protein